MTQLNITGTEAQKAIRHALLRKTPAEVDAWVEANVNTMADAKAFLKILAKALVVVARESRNA